jgi:hypothetical protein
LSGGFLPDPRTWGVTSGGSVDVSYLGGTCVGWAAQAPDFQLSWSGGTQLRFYWIANIVGDDAVLVVNDPAGNWHCNDDSYSTLNPTVTFGAAMNGTYDVWVGSRWNGDFDSGTLYVTELGGNHP